MSRVNSPFRSASTWVTSRVADSSCCSWTSREAMVSDSRARPSSEVRTSSGVSEKVSASTSKDWAIWAVSMSSMVEDRSANASTTS
jgi:hypothetical protein